MGTNNNDLMLFTKAILAAFHDLGQRPVLFASPWKTGSGYIGIRFYKQLAPAWCLTIRLEEHSEPRILVWRPVGRPGEVANRPIDAPPLEDPEFFEKCIKLGSSDRQSPPAFKISAC